MQNPLFLQSLQDRNRNFLLGCARWSIIRERTKAGLAEALKAGRKLGRRFKLSEADRQQIIYLVREGKMTAADCARTYRVHESNISRLLATAKIKETIS